MARWHEELHPRDSDGQFTDKPGGWAGRVSGLIGGLFNHHVRGTDRSDEVYGEDFEEEARQAAYEADFWDGDVALAKVMQLQGWDAPGRTGTDQQLQEAIDQGGVELWRGYKGQVPELWGWGRDKGAKAPFSPADSPMAYVQRMIDGPLRPGTGIYANGWYTSVDHRVAEHYGMVMWLPTPRVPSERDLEEHRARWGDYADKISVNQGSSRNRYDENGEVVGTEYEHPDPRSIQRMVLSPNARVVEYDSSTLDDLLNRVGGRTYVGEQRAGDFSRGQPLYEYGAAAAALGYDAIKITGRGDGSGRDADQWVILNRTAVLFGEPYDEANLPDEIVSLAQWQAARSPG